MRGLAWVGALVLLGCGAAEPQEVSLGGLLEPPPESLSALAEEVRAAGGVVFVGTATAAPAPTSSAFAEAPYEGVRVELPRSTATVTLHDALGASMGSEIVLVAAAGPARLVDEGGSPSADYVLSGDPEDRWLRASLPEEGTWLFFTQPDGERDVVVWRAAVEGGTASGEGTLGGDDEPLDDLRLVP